MFFFAFFFFAGSTIRENRNIVSCVCDGSGGVLGGVPGCLPQCNNPRGGGGGLKPPKKTVPLLLLVVDKNAHKLPLAGAV